MDERPQGPLLLPVGTSAAAATGVPAPTEPAVVPAAIETNGTHAPSEPEPAASAEERVEALAENLRAELMALEAQVAAVDPNLRVPLARLVHRQRDELRKFADKLRSQRRNQAGRFRQHARRLVGELMPRGRLQERVLPALPFLVRHGLGFARELIEAADPFAGEHLLLEWRE